MIIIRHDREAEDIYFARMSIPQPVNDMPPQPEVSHKTELSIVLSAGQKHASVL